MASEQAKGIWLRRNGTIVVFLDPISGTRDEAGAHGSAQFKSDVDWEHEVSPSFWRMRPPVRYQANRYICWAEAFSSWSMVTSGVKKFAKGSDAIKFFKARGMVNSDDSLKLPEGMEDAAAVFGLKFKKFEGGGTLSNTAIGPLLRRSHLMVVFKRPGASYFHFVVVYGVDRFSICFMDPELNPRAPDLDPIKQNRVCAPIWNFGAGAEEFFVFWKDR